MTVSKVPGPAAVGQALVVLLLSGLGLPGMGLQQEAIAQNTEATLYGRAAAGATVQVTNLDTGQAREVQADSRGEYRFARLAPGRYRVASAGGRRDVEVAMGAGVQVDLVAERVLIAGDRSLAGLDFTSAETSTTLTQQQLRALPLPRDVAGVALLAPGVVKGDKDLGGGLPSFGGASVAENGYYINGFDVTNIRNFLSYAKLPFDAIAQQQVKTGGYGAEYGRSLGGVVSLVTQRGTNTWKAGASVYAAPAALKARSRNVDNLDNPGDYTVFESRNRQSDLSFNVYAGGPLVKDTLFVFALLEAEHNVGSSVGKTTSTRTVSGRPNGLLKLDWSVTDRHVLEFTGITNRRRSSFVDRVNVDAYTPPANVAATSSASAGGGDVAIAKYTGYLTDSFSVSALVGRVNEKVDRTTGARVAELSCPVVLDTNLAEIGCWTKPFPGPTVRDPKAPADGDTRRAARLDAELSVGAHTLRAGVDVQRFRSAEAGTSTYSGGYYYRYFASANGTVNGVANAVAPGGLYVRRRENSSTSGVYQVDNAAAYVEDSWRVGRDWLLYGGLRSESFDNQNGDGESFVKARNLLAPRMGLTWNVRGDGTVKLFASAGRYYIPVASNTNIRMTRGELFEQRFFTFTGRDPVTQAPLGLGPSLGTPQIVSDGRLPRPATVADTQLKPMNQDELVLGAEHALARGWTLGVKGVYRRINDGMDDFCGHGALDRWAQDNGHRSFDSSTAATCVLINPGRDMHVQLDLQGDGVLVPVTVPARYLGLDKYRRTYQALQFTLDKPFDGRWGLSASYTWSKSRGTAEGYVSSTINQTDAGVTQDFDFGSLTHGANGYLPNDRRHVVKVFGNVAMSDRLRVGLNASAASGRPRSCIGFVPPSVADFADAQNYTAASSYYCLNDTTRLSELVPRGSAGRLPWTFGLDANLSYTAAFGSGKLTLQADMFNVLNLQHVTEVNETRDYGRDTTTAVAADNKLSLNYGRPTAFQAPRSVRLSARYEF